MNVLVAFAVLGCSTEIPVPPVYELEDLDFPESWIQARAQCMDSTGSIIVVSNLSNTETASSRGLEVIIIKGDGYETIANDPDYPLTWVTGILDDGTIYGHRTRVPEIKPDERESILFADGPTKILKETLSKINPDLNMILVAANKNGDIVGNLGGTPGWGSPDPDAGYAFVDGVERIEKDWIFYDINSSGTVLCKQTEYRDAVFLYQKGKFVSLFAKSHSAYAPEFIPVALNDHNSVAGNESDYPKSLVVFENNTLLRIQGQPVHFSGAADINNRGEVAGLYWYGGGSGPGNLPDADGFLWSEGRMYELGDLVEWPEGWRLTYVHQISEKGDILVTLQRQSPFREKPVILRRK